MIYFDYNTTCPMDEAHLINVFSKLKKIKGNAASPHIGGDQTRLAIESSRRNVSKLVGASEKEVFFCSGATEANNIAVNSALESFFSQKDFFPEIVLGADEHVSMKLPAKRWEKREICKVHLAPLLKNGDIDDKRLSELINENTVFVSVMHVNNETGVKHDIKRLAFQVKQINPKIHFHSDAVQAVGKIECTELSDGLIDSYAFSSHKIGGFPGVGALFFRDSSKLSSTLLGGSQENNRRAGTENIPGIISMGIRAEEISNPEWLNNAVELGNLFKDRAKEIPGLVLHGENTLSTCANFHIENVSLNVILEKFEQHEICAAACAAFSATESKPSATLMAMGYPKSVSGNSIRVSFGKDNTEDEINTLIEIFKGD